MQIVVGALSPDNLANTLNWATPLVGMTLAAAIPLRGGMINLGGDGQMVIGALVGAMTPLRLPLPGPLAAAFALIGAALAGGLYAALAALGRNPLSHSDADLEPVAELSRGRRRVLSRALSLARHDDRPAADRASCRESARLPALVAPANAGLVIVVADRAAVRVSSTGAASSATSCGCAG